MNYESNIDSEQYDDSTLKTQNYAEITSATYQEHAPTDMQNEILENISTKFYSASSGQTNNVELPPNFSTIESTITEATGAGRIQSTKQSSFILPMTQHTEKSTKKSTGQQSTKQISKGIPTKSQSQYPMSLTNYHQNKKSTTTILINKQITTVTHRTSMDNNKTEKAETESKIGHDYDKIMPEYSFEIDELKSENVAYNFTDDEIEKTLRNLIGKTLDFKKPRNCSQFKGFKFGIKAMECVIADLRAAKNRIEVLQILKKSWKIAKVWLCIYICITIPCWCQYG